MRKDGSVIRCTKREEIAEHIQETLFNHFKNLMQEISNMIMIVIR